MCPSDSSDPGSTNTSNETGYVYCRACGTKAPSDWTFCRSCQNPLDDALPPERKQELLDDVYAEGTDDEPGCPKCGRAEAEVEIVETTGTAVTPRIAADNDRFRVVSCTHCGYCEFFKGGDPDILTDLFLER